jgi:hypothetical protein
VAVKPPGWPVLMAQAKVGALSRTKRTQANGGRRLKRAALPDRRRHRGAAEAILEMGAHGPANEGSAKESKQRGDKTAEQDRFSHHSDAGWRNKSVLHRSSTLWSSS